MSVGVWNAGKNNMGFGMNRKTWEEIKSCKEVFDTIVLVMHYVFDVVLSLSLIPSTFAAMMITIGIGLSILWASRACNEISKCWSPSHQGYST